MDKDAVTIIQSSLLGKESVVGQISKIISKFFSMFLMMPFTLIEVRVYENRMSHGGGYGLKILLKYCFYGKERIVQWLTKKLKTAKK